MNLSRLKLIKGDITHLHVDAIVNAANTSLLGGGGVDGAIHQAAGPGLLRACRALGGCPTGQAKLTQGYQLPVKWVIHTVGPVWQNGTAKEEELLASCYRNSLNLAAEKGIKTIAFPSISTGAYRFPLERAVPIALEEMKTFLDKNHTIQKIVVACFSDMVFQTYHVYKKKMLESN